MSKWPMRLLYRAENIKRKLFKCNEHRQRRKADLSTDAIHPGYGFLAENADFAELCEELNVTFVGPTADAISKMGTKDIARDTMQLAGVPIVPGSKGIIKIRKKRFRLQVKLGILSL